MVTPSRMGLPPSAAHAGGGADHRRWRSDDILVEENHPAALTHCAPVSDIGADLDC